MHMRFVSRLPYRFGIAVLALAAWCGMPRGAGADVNAASDGPVVTASDNGNSLETRQIQIDNARVPGRASTRQSITAWQVTQGMWNGQVLDGLCVVLVKSTSENGRAGNYTNCYVSQEATMAQRQALLLAFMSAQPGLISADEMGSMRLEPAVISLDMEGMTLVLHLGLVA